MMVCLGNICRSPLAHGILDEKVRINGLDWVVESSGTSGWHVGELPDPRSIEVAKKNGLDLTYQRSRKFIQQDLEDYDLIIAMDSNNYNDILKLAGENQKHKVSLLMNYAYPNENRQVPDPYHHGGFQSVYDMIEIAVSALIDQHS